MKVNELIVLLQTFPPDLKVMVAEEYGGAEEVDLAYQTMICDNYDSQPRVLFGLLKRKPPLPTRYRISQGEIFETGIGSAIILDF